MLGIGMQLRLQSEFKFVSKTTFHKHFVGLGFYMAESAHTYLNH